MGNWFGWGEAGDIARAAWHDQFDVYDNDAFCLRKRCHQLRIFMDGCTSVHAQARAVAKIDEQHADMGIEQNVTEAHIGAIAFHARFEMRERQAICSQYLDQTGSTALNEQSHWPSGELVARKKNDAASILAHTCSGMRFQISWFMRVSVHSSGCPSVAVRRARRCEKAIKSW